MLLLSALACTGASPDDTAAASPADTAADTATDTDGPVRDASACDGTILAPLDAAVVTVDWSARSAPDRSDAAVLAGPAADLQVRACAGDLTQAEVQALWTYDAARDGVVTAGAFDLSPYAGAALLLRLEDASGETTWFADILPGGVAVISLE